MRGPQQLALFSATAALYPSMHWKTKSHWLELWQRVAALENRGRIVGGVRWDGVRWRREMGIDIRSVRAMETAGALSREGDDFLLVGYDAAREDRRDAERARLVERARTNANLRWARERERWRAATSDPRSDPRRGANYAESLNPAMLSSNARARAPEIPDLRSLPSVPDPLLAGLQPTNDPAPIPAAVGLAGRLAALPPGLRKVLARYPRWKLRARQIPEAEKRWQLLELEPHAEAVLELLERELISETWREGKIPWLPNFVTNAAVVVAVRRKPAPRPRPPAAPAPWQPREQWPSHA